MCNGVHSSVLLYSKFCHLCPSTHAIETFRRDLSPYWSPETTLQTLSMLIFIALVLCELDIVLLVGEMCYFMAFLRVVWIKWSSHGDGEWKMQRYIITNSIFNGTHHQLSHCWCDLFSRWGCSIALSTTATRCQWIPMYKVQGLFLVSAQFSDCLCNSGCSPLLIHCFTCKPGAQFSFCFLSLSTAVCFFILQQRFK